VQGRPASRRALAADGRSVARTRPSEALPFGRGLYGQNLVSLDASIVAQAREQLGAPVAGLADDALIERAVNAYLLRRMVDASQAAAGLNEEEAQRVAHEELAASRRERHGGA
jgi:hypothetical protein